MSIFKVDLPPETPTWQSNLDYDSIVAHNEALEAHIKVLKAQVKELNHANLEDEAEIRELEAERGRLKDQNEGLRGEILLSTVPLEEHRELRTRNAELEAELARCREMYRRNA